MLMQTSSQMSTLVPLSMATPIPLSMAISMPESISMYPDFVTSYDYLPTMSQTPTCYCFIEGGDDAFEDEDDDGDEDKHKGGGEYEEDEDNGHDLVEEPTPLVVHKNPMHTRQPLPYNTHSP
ncbi:hypothetical protein J1N35_011217 [Gossypium stocksii]|uniref:Uncharacterized protein n=1 Tax=Gossypium stocksii TaxID=47602 RepID=A0A9D3W1Z7_9ROSI|nr:hypothetical protein J1N35_011217 [Gossypium stocksii]